MERDVGPILRADQPSLEVGRMGADHAMRRVHSSPFEIHNEARRQHIQYPYPQSHFDRPQSQPTRRGICGGAPLEKINPSLEAYHFEPTMMGIGFLLLRTKNAAPATATRATTTAPPTKAVVEEEGGGTKVTWTDSLLMPPEVAETLTAVAEVIDPERVRVDVAWPLEPDVTVDGDRTPGLDAVKVMLTPAKEVPFWSRAITVTVEPDDEEVRVTVVGLAETCREASAGGGGPVDMTDTVPEP